MKSNKKTPQLESFSASEREFSQSSADNTAKPDLVVCQLIKVRVKP